MQHPFLVRAIVAVTASIEQSAPEALPTDTGMYWRLQGSAKVIGQIAEFKLSALVSHATIGIKSKKENVQLIET